MTIETLEGPNAGFLLNILKSGLTTITGEKGELQRLPKICPKKLLSIIPRFFLNAYQKTHYFFYYHGEPSRNHADFFEKNGQSCNHAHLLGIFRNYQEHVLTGQSKTHARPPRQVKLIHLSNVNNIITTFCICSSGSSCLISDRVVIIK